MYLFMFSREVLLLLSFSCYFHISSYSYCLFFYLLFFLYKIPLKLFVHITHERIYVRGAIDCLRETNFIFKLRFNQDKRRIEYKFYLLRRRRRRRKIRFCPLHAIKEFLDELQVRSHSLIVFKSFCKKNSHFVIVYSYAYNRKIQTKLCVKSYASYQRVLANSHQYTTVIHIKTFQAKTAYALRSDRNHFLSQNQVSRINFIKLY